MGRCRIWSLLTCLLALLPLSCAGVHSGSASGNGQGPIEAAAEAFVHCALALGQHDPLYVDAYFGPPAWRRRAEQERRPLHVVHKEARALLARLEQLPLPADEAEQLRLLNLRVLVRGLVTRAEMRLGKRFDFDEEARAIFDIQVKSHSDEEFRPIMARFEALLPGTGSLLERYTAYRKQFIVPPEKVDRVFRAAIAECRSRTIKHIPLPAGEGITVEYVRNKPWSGYNGYQGNYRSLIQINMDRPCYVDRLLALACHEGYPGHHVWGVLQEQHLAKERGWIEYTIAPLFSHVAVLNEGAAVYGLDLALPPGERVSLMKRVLFPMAGLPTDEVERYEEVAQLRLKAVVVLDATAGRRYVRGEASAAKTRTWLMQYELLPAEQADSAMRFYEEYRSYVATYPEGRELIRRYVEAQGGTADQPSKQWQLFEGLIVQPRLPSQLQ